MKLDCELYCQHCVICNRAKPDPRNGASLQPLVIPEYPWEFFWINHVTDFPQSCVYGHTTVFILVWHLIKMAHFVLCREENIAEESTDYLKVILIDYMVFLKYLSQVEILGLLENSGKASWKIWTLNEIWVLLDTLVLMVWRKEWTKLCKPYWDVIVHNLVSIGPHTWIRLNFITIVR